MQGPGVRAKDGRVAGRTMPTSAEVHTHHTPARRVVWGWDSDQGWPRDLWPPHQPQS